MLACSLCGQREKEPPLQDSPASRLLMVPNQRKADVQSPTSALTEHQRVL